MGGGRWLVERRMKERGWKSVERKARPMIELEREGRRKGIRWRFVGSSRRDWRSRR